MLTATVRRWWFEADAWRDPEAQRMFLARVDGYVAEGLLRLGSASPGRSSGPVPAPEVAYRWELDGPAQLDTASLPEHVRQELDLFMERSRS